MDFKLPPLELWAGVECTLNRVGERCMDQLERTGHAHRLTDLDRFAELGLTRIRYPILWERTAPQTSPAPHHASWHWPDERLSRLRQLGIDPIVGLVHHGSGPRWTDLTQPSFAHGLAAFAEAVAQRYPWVTWYTPVNEPLTTARFSGLYGHWHPHARDALTFARILLNQCRAVVLAMQRIRAVNPRARLLQPEDAGKTFSTPELSYQATFENHRRWLTFDLLCGRVGATHPMWPYLCSVGIAPAELEWFAKHPCPPDVIGVNYYVASERYLDHRLERYPAWTHGGNGQHAYADVEAVRVRAAGLAGPAAVLSEAWHRYHRPVAATEVHLADCAAEQVRWFWEVWQAAKTLRAAGQDVRAVTAWALLGAYDWDSLVTCHRGRYEPGVFDVSSGSPQATPMVDLLRALARNERPRDPALARPGWWRQPERLIYPPVVEAAT